MKMNKTLGLGCVSVILSFICAMPARADRMYRPMGDYVREAELIAICDTHRGGTSGFETVLSITEVIRGDPKAAGTEMVLGGMRSTAEAHLPTPARGVAVLLRKQPPERDRSPVLEAYAKPEEIATVRTLVRIYSEPGERRQLLLLREQALKPDDLCLAQFLADLAGMHGPANFDLMVGLYDALSPANQVKLLDIMARTNDPRAVPILLKAMASPDEKVSTAAAGPLSWQFAGAPGVTEAFEQALAQKHLARTAASYLAKRRDDPALEKINEERVTPWVRAERLRKAGRKEEARAAYLAIVENPNDNSYATNEAAKKLLADATPAEKDRIRLALLPRLTAAARDGNYIEAANAARILRQLHHPDCLEALLALSPRTDWSFRDAARIAILAIHDLGADARRQGVERLMANLGPAATKPSQEADARTFHLLAILWLGDKETPDRITGALPESWQKAWADLGPLASIASQKDEAAFLIQVLDKPGSLPVSGREWAAFRLGDLKDPRAVKVLTANLLREADWRSTQTTRDALISIGGPDVEREMLALLMDEDRTRIRPAAIEVLFRLQGERSADLARRMLREDDFGLKMPAMNNLSSVGTPEDLALLLPYCDYWKADRSTHYWAVHAVIGIRDRFNYDVNGPIVKGASTK